MAWAWEEQVEVGFGGGADHASAESLAEKSSTCTRWCHCVKSGEAEVGASLKGKNRDLRFITKPPRSLLLAPSLAAPWGPSHIWKDWNSALSIDSNATCSSVVHTSEV